ncbi:hypothetical protein TNCV_2164891 [Trichonephila clavipes]|nr:hypothetical protein TNCV_2164891 [Trichonephila clavipes]
MGNQGYQALKAVGPKHSECSRHSRTLQSFFVDLTSHFAGLIFLQLIRCSWVSIHHSAAYAYDHRTPFDRLFDTLRCCLCKLS